MDLGFLDFDTSSYIFGALTMGGTWLVASKGKGLTSKKRNEAREEELKRSIKSIESSYLEWTKKYQPLEERYASAAADFNLTFTENPEKSWSNFRIDRFVSSSLVRDGQNTLNEMLVMLNDIKTANLQEIDLGAMERNWHTLEGKMNNTIYPLNGAITMIESASKNKPHEIMKAQKSVQTLGSRMDAARKTITHIESAYEPLFWHKIPLALKRAETAYENLLEESKHLNPHFYYYPKTLNKRITDAETMINRLENHIDKVVNYKDVAHRKVNKLRRELNSAWQRSSKSTREKVYPRPAEQMYEEANLSLLKAETQEYPGGNPEKIFEETIKPYTFLMSQISKKK